MVLMDKTMEEETPQHKRARSIKINTKIQPASPSNGTPNKSRRSILKKFDSKTSEDINKNESTREPSNDLDVSQKRFVPPNNSSMTRPHNLEEYIKAEGLSVKSVESSFNLDSLSDSEDIWLMDIPKTIDPRDLAGQRLILGEKSKFKIKEERYCTVNHDIKGNITCVFHPRKGNLKYKTVNATPVGMITIRKKLAGTQKIKPMRMEETSVPFPKNLKMRHPLLGANHEGTEEFIRTKAIDRLREHDPDVIR